jgi:hypothetical protein
MKMAALLATFPNYRVAIVRYEESKLKETTMKTFFKPYVCPPELYAPPLGNHTPSMNKTKFINNSEILWMNLKDTDEGMVRGLEVNSVLVDQAEEISENMARLLSARVGRWDGAKVPEELLASRPDWPMTKFGKPRVPNYFAIMCNPDSELHWIWKRFHPDSPEYQTKYKKNHFMVQGVTTLETVDEELLDEMMQNDITWVDRFVLGKWGIPGGQVHQMQEASILDPDEEHTHAFINKAITRGDLYRVLDHGDSAPTVCLWFACYLGLHVCYREYYLPNALVSDHRKNIAELSGDEKYVASLADPAIFKKSQQKYGGRWCTADEYTDSGIKYPAINFQPADNNEFATRNRISEACVNTLGVRHPVTGDSLSPRLYFIKKTAAYPNGVSHAISQMRAQKRKKIGTDTNGQDFYSDDRDEKVPDHAYDCVRYYIAHHAAGRSAKNPKAGPGSFFALREQIKQIRGQYGA